MTRLLKLLHRDLSWEWLGGHQNHESVARYHIWVDGKSSEDLDFYSDYVDGVGEAKRAALVDWKERGLIQ